MDRFKQGTTGRALKETLRSIQPDEDWQGDLRRLREDLCVVHPGALPGHGQAGPTALVPVDEYEALEETAEVLSDPDALSALEEGLGEIERDETITLAELRTELAERRRSGG
jgi:hypothetical protein